MKAHYDLQRDGHRLAPGELLVDYDGGREVLSYAGPRRVPKGQPKPVAQCNRDESKCDSKFCEGALPIDLTGSANDLPEANKLSPNIKLSCDEWPPGKLSFRRAIVGVSLTCGTKASAIQGGGFSGRACVPNEQNSAQGAALNALRARCDLQAGDPYVVGIEGGCKDVPLPKDWVQDPLKKREVDHKKREETVQTTAIEGTSSEFASPLADGSFMFVAVSLDELQQGKYELTVIFNGTVDLLSVVDYTGEEFVS